MIWMIIVFGFSLLLQAGAGYAAGDIMARALEYDLPRGKAIWGGLLIVLLLLLRTWLEHHFAPEKKSKAVFRIPVAAVWLAGSLALALVPELYVDLGMPVPVTVMLLFTIGSLVYERELYLQFFRIPLEDGEESPTPEEEEEKRRKQEAEDYAFAADQANQADKDGKSDQTDQMEVVNIIVDMGIEEESGEEAPDGVAESAVKESAKEDASEEKSAEEDALTPRGDAHPAFYLAARILAFSAAVLIAILSFSVIYDAKNRFRAYIFMFIAAILTIVLRLIPGERTGAEEEKKRFRRIILAVVVLLVTVWLCTRSLLMGSIFLLDAFLIGVLIPALTYRFAIGGTDVVAEKTDFISRITARVMLVILIVISSWLVSYGAVWEVEFLMMIGTVAAMQELLMSQNLSVPEPVDDEELYGAEPVEE